MRELLLGGNRVLRNKMKALLAIGKTADEISEVLKDEQLRQTRILAKYIYNEEGTFNGGEDMLYTLIKVQGKDTLLRVGAGNFEKADFLDTNGNSSWGLKHTPIPLFVVEEGNDQEKKDPKNYLQKHTKIVVRRAGEADEITDKHKIDFGRIHIMSSEIAEKELQKTVFKKIMKDFPDKAVYEVVQKIANYSELELMNRTLEKKQAHFEKEEIENAIRSFFHTCIKAEGNEIHQLIQDIKSYVNDLKSK